MPVVNVSTPEERAACRPAVLEHETWVEEIKEEARSRARAQRQPPHDPLRALSVPELFALPRTDYLVDQWLPEGALAEFVGDTGTLKSFVAIDLGLTIASDSQSDFHGLPVLKHGPVLYIAAEGAGAFQYRLRAWGAQHKVDVTSVPFFTIIAPVNLRDAAFQAELAAIVADKKPLLIIVDTLHRCIPGAEENSSRDIGEVVGFSQQIQAQVGAAVLFLHHPPKSDPSGRGRGSSALYYAADTEWSAVQEGEDREDGTKIINVSVVKQKDDSNTSLKLVNRIVPVLDQHGGQMCRDSGRDLTSCVLEIATDEDVAAAADVLPQKILAFLREHPGSTTDEIRAGVKVKKVTVAATLETLRLDNAIQQEKVGRRHEYSLSLLKVNHEA
jgi:hypothetical protein